MKVLRLTRDHLHEFRALMSLFAREFDDQESYALAKPRDEYVSKHLSKEHIIHLVAKKDEEVVGGLVAYVLEKFEQERNEVYIYDLAVSSSFRRQGIATTLINELKQIAKTLNAWVMYVQADYVDPPAIKLYESLGKKEEVLHFDIEV